METIKVERSSSLKKKSVYSFVSLLKMSLAIQRPQRKSVFPAGKTIGGKGANDNNCACILVKGTTTLLGLFHLPSKVCRKTGSFEIQIGGGKAFVLEDTFPSRSPGTSQKGSQRLNTCKSERTSSQMPGNFPTCASGQCLTPPECPSPFQ